MCKRLLQDLLLLATVLLVFGAPFTSIAADRVYLDITAPEIRKIKIAVPWFLNKSLAGDKQKLGRDLSITLGKALAFHGIIEIPPQEQYADNQGANWSQIGADYAVLGQYTLASDGIKFEIRLLDVAGDEIVLGKTFSGANSQRDQMLFKFCDDVIEHLTGQPGIATSRIAFVNGMKNVKEVFLTDILGNNFRQVTRHKHLTVSPRFVPGGPYMTYSSYHTGNQNLYITDLRQDKVTRALSRRKGLNLAPAWSADGSYMILTLSNSGLPDLYMLNGKGEIIEQITDHAGINVSPTLSPDNNYMVFVSDRSGKPQLYLMDMRTRKIKRITFEGTENAEPSWSPKENLIVFSSLRNGVYQLYTMDPFSDEMAKPLTTDMSHHESPCWSPDGNQVIFAKRDGARHQIYAILKNGSFQRRLFTLPGTQTYPQWAR